MKRLTWDIDREDILENLREEYDYRQSTQGKRLARWWYRWHALRSILPSLGFELKWRMVMLKNHLLIAIRNLKKQKGLSLINIVGLAVGMACSIMILLFVQFERSYDRFHEKSDRIHRVAVNAKWGNTRIAQTYTPAIMTPTLYQDYPEVELCVRLWTFLVGTEVRRDEKVFNEYRVTSADPEFFQMFSFPLISGKPESVLRDPNSVVLSSSTAKKYFGEKDPMDHNLTIDGNNFRITGVMEDMPANSHFHFDMIVSIVTYDGINSTNWFACNYRTYILLREGVSGKNFEAKFPDLVNRHSFRGQYEDWTQNGNFWEFYLQPLADIHLHSDLDGELEANGNAAYVTLFFVIAVFILLLAAVNYMNLSTARSAGRAREVGIRKVSGAGQSLLVRQFLAESILTSLIALVLAMVLIHLFLPFFGNLVQRQLAIPYKSIPWIVPGFTGLAAGIGILSGAYPSFFLSSFRPVTVMQGNVGSVSKNKSLRRILVFFQFAISISLFIGTLTVRQQMLYIMNKDLGFRKEQVIVVKTPESLGAQSAPFKEALRKNPSILEVSGSNTLPGKFFPNCLVEAEGFEQGVTMNISLCEPEFKDVIRLQMARGRFFSREFGTDSTALILNQTAVKLLGWEEPIGKTIIPGMGIQFHVIGVAQDFHFESLHQTVRPAAIALLSGAWDWWPEQYISLLVQSENISSTLSYLQSTWDRLNTGKPVEYTFLDEDYANLYQNEQRTGRLFTIFSSLALFIACLGLFGLSSFSTEKRTREIGIRKVVGASIPGLIGLLFREFAGWVALANIFAWPVTYFFMNTWLQNFAYRVNPSGWNFIISGLTALFIALMTVSYHSIKAAIANPVEALRYE